MKTLGPEAVALLSGLPLEDLLKPPDVRLGQEMEVLCQRIPQLRAVGEVIAVDLHKSNIVAEERSPRAVDFLQPATLALAAVPGRPPVLSAEDVPHRHVHMGAVECPPLAQPLHTGGSRPKVLPNVHHGSRKAYAHLQALERHHAGERRGRRLVGLHEEDVPVG
eukprot:scaffold1861_cov312-Pinguiococcus_pyrenoidosus.AAC.8